MVRSDLPGQCSVFELRQYTMRPGMRDTKIELFDREFVETQEACGMRIVGQFRDIDQPDRFVWIRAFSNMTSRAAALTSFYDDGPVWAAHRDAARAATVDTTDALLLRPITPRDAALMADTRRPPIGSREIPPSWIVATICFRDAPVDDAFVGFFEDDVRSVLDDTGGGPLACFRTEPAENTYPAFPVRSDENVFVWLSLFASPQDYETYLQRLDRSEGWTRKIRPGLRARLREEPKVLRLSPTTRSALR